MAKADKTVYTCDRCEKEHESEGEADNCYESHPETKSFNVLLEQYHALRQKVQELCPHRRVVFGPTYDTVDFTDFPITVREAVCEDCDSDNEVKVTN